MRPVTTTMPRIGYGCGQRYVDVHQRQPLRAVGDSAGIPPLARRADVARSMQCRPVFQEIPVPDVHRCAHWKLRRVHERPSCVRFVIARRRPSNLCSSIDAVAASPMASPLQMP